MADSRGSGGLIGLGLAIALGTVVSAMLVSDAMRDIKAVNEALEVKGFAERRILSDYATWQGTFTARSTDLQRAYADLERYHEATLAFLSDHAVPADAFEFLPVSMSVAHVRTEKGIATSEVEGYVLSQTVAVQSADIDLVTRLSREASSLVKQGIEFSSFRPEYLYTKLGDLKLAMLAEATADAKLRAETLAENSGGRLDALVSARQGVFQITPAHSTEVSDYGRYDTTTREKSIKAVVTVRFSVRR